jgi:hypothetical protein
MIDLHAAKELLAGHVRDEYSVDDPVVITQVIDRGYG